MQTEFFKHALTHLKFLRLAGGGQWKFAHDSQITRRFVMRHARAAKLYELFCFSSLSILQYHLGS